jgi:tryptophan-rich sensory protein
MNTLASQGQLRTSFVRWALVLVPGTLLLGYLSSELAGGGASDPWFEALAKPATFPPAATFVIVWTVLYVMIGFAAALVGSAWGARERGVALTLFAVQLVLNLAWTPVFFGAHQITGGLVLICVLFVAAAATTIQFFRIRRLAGWLMVPYLLWLAFAAVLNWQFLQLNPDADGRAGASGPSIERVRI